MKGDVLKNRKTKTKGVLKAKAFVGKNLSTCNIELLKEEKSLKKTEGFFFDFLREIIFCFLDKGTKN